MATGWFHGGRSFSETVVIDEAVKTEIAHLFSLAPLHNPPNLEGIKVAEEIFAHARQVAVFDTAFHQSMPARAYKYAIPNVFLEEHHIRVYGFHGTSHKYVSEKAAEYLGPACRKMITLHLGNGCSMTAIQDGRSVDHTLGFGPATGLIMGTRSGDLDHSVVFYLMEELGYSADEVNSMLQRKSGMLGLTGHNDLRDIQKKAEAGNADCQLALEMNAYRIKKYIGAYAAAMNGLDALVFTAGIGENSVHMRERICRDLDYLGIELNGENNRLARDGIREIQTDESKVKILIIPTNEELEIARQAFALVGAAVG